MEKGGGEGYKGKRARLLQLYYFIPQNLSFLRFPPHRGGISKSLGRIVRILEIRRSSFSSWFFAFTIAVSRRLANGEAKRTRNDLEEDDKIMQPRRGRAN